jgi:hypothetical protein
MTLPHNEDVSWIHNEDDQMELGTSGWSPFGEGKYKNIYTGNVIDEMGNEYDSNGNLIFENRNPYGDGIES